MKLLPALLEDGYGVWHTTESPLYASPFGYACGPRIVGERAFDCTWPKKGDESGGGGSELHCCVLTGWSLLLVWK